MEVSGLSRMLDAPTKAVLQRPSFSDDTAVHSASRPDEQAVSTVKLGPVKSIPNVLSRVLILVLKAQTLLSLLPTD